MAELSAIDFAQATQRSLPHIIVDPLPVEAYLQDVQSTLRFLPRDWKLPTISPNRDLDT